MDQHPENFLHILDTNAELNGNETIHFRGRLQALDDFVARLLDRRRQYLALLSPWRRLPHDLLAEIFIHVVESIGQYHQWDLQEVLSRLSLVCRRWHDVVLKTHRLWSTLEIHGPFTPLVSTHLETWFKRAGDVPKSLTFSAPECPSSNPSHACFIYNHALAQFLAQGPSLNHFSMHCANPLCLRYGLQLMKALRKEPAKGTWSTIKSLQLVFNQEWTERNPLHPERSVFHLLPPITSLDLRLPPLPRRHSPQNAHLGVDWDEVKSDPSLVLHIPETLLSSLTLLTLHCNWNGALVLSILKPCKSLQSLELDFASTTQIFGNPQEIQNLADNNIILPHLRILRLRHTKPDTLDLFHLLLTPSLTELDLDFERDDNWLIPSSRSWHELLSGPLLGLVERSKCRVHVERLRLKTLHDVDEDVLQRILLGLPALTHLTTDDVDLYPSLLCKLAFAEPPALARLQRLEMYRFKSNALVGLVKYLGLRKRRKELEGIPFTTTDVLVKASSGTVLRMSKGVATLTSADESEDEDD
ncbi:hypothetical protein DFP72DRAFT_1141240 [Ephemerocybe angulata]|uniref:F-box domain-containing protein n=1 Tax=Ephemerocybe angulata TaxID=980116 RepID=A0A8H6ID94_9AGAR|nr:hypothetical protein DFP72DRAFT_1141235 [Tulosesus angulatus]KAF6763367.1 hypothetical protein DFP72DRAFT_1141240 [Tulosesus angulatus]